jgi:nucleotide-binding universal stress UspA family protein
MKMQLRNILYTTDFSERSNSLLSYGLAFAREFGAKLYVCHIVDIPVTSIYAEYSESFLDLTEHRERMTEDAKKQIEQLMEGTAIDWEPLVIQGHPADEIALIPESKDIDLVVSATHGRSGLKRLVIGSVTERLMRTVPCPLLVVRRPDQESRAGGGEDIGLKKILLGCDFSPDSNLAVEYGLSLAQQFQTELHLVHVIEPSVYKALIKQETEEKTQEDLRILLNDKLTNIVPEEARFWCKPTTMLLAGQPYKEIIKYAVVNKIDLIIVGFRGLGMVETILVGSTTARVVRQAPCPVLSVRPKFEPESSPEGK